MVSQKYTITGIQKKGQTLTVEKSQPIVTPSELDYLTTYQWQISYDGGETWSNIDLATNATYTPTVTAFYRVELSKWDGDSGELLNAQHSVSVAIPEEIDQKESTIQTKTEEINATQTEFNRNKEQQDITSGSITTTEIVKNELENIVTLKEELDDMDTRITQIISLKEKERIRNEKAEEINAVNAKVSEIESINSSLTRLNNSLQQASTRKSDAQENYTYAENKYEAYDRNLFHRRLGPNRGPYVKGLDPGDSRFGVWNPDNLEVSEERHTTGDWLDPYPNGIWWIRQWATTPRSDGNKKINLIENWVDTDGYVNSRLRNKKYYGNIFAPDFGKPYVWTETMGKLEDEYRAKKSEFRADMETYEGLIEGAESSIASINSQIASQNSRKTQLENEIANKNELENEYQTAISNYNAEKTSFETSEGITYDTTGNDSFFSDLLETAQQNKTQKQTEYEEALGTRTYEYVENRLKTQIIPDLSQLNSICQIRRERRMTKINNTEGEIAQLEEDIETLNTTRTTPQQTISTLLTEGVVSTLATTPEGYTSIAIGDPYIYPMCSSVPVKLPDVEASYRLYQCDNTFINAEVSIATKEHKNRMIKFVERIGHDTKDVITDGYFFSKFFIVEGKNKMVIDLRKKTFSLLEGSNKKFFHISRNKNNAGNKDWNGKAINAIIQWVTEEGNKMKATVSFFANPHIENGISLSVSNLPEKALGLCVSNYRPKLMRVPFIMTEKHSKIERQVKKSRNPFQKIAIQSNREKWIKK